jgi:hypothetical protein
MFLHGRSFIATTTAPVPLTVDGTFPTRCLRRSLRSSTKALRTGYHRIIHLSRACTVSSCLSFRLQITWPMTYGTLWKTGSPWVLRVLYLHRRFSSLFLASALRPVVTLSRLQIRLHAVAELNPHDIAGSGVTGTEIPPTRQSVVGLILCLAVQKEGTAQSDWDFIDKYSTLPTRYVITDKDKCTRWQVREGRRGFLCTIACLHDISGMADTVSWCM